MADFVIPEARIGLVDVDGGEGADEDVPTFVEVGGKRYTFDGSTVLGKGSFGRVHPTSNPNYVIKILDLRTPRLRDAFKGEVQLQQKVHAAVPEACPAIEAYGKFPGTDEHFVIMEAMKESAHAYLVKPGVYKLNRDAFALECLKQIASHLQKLEAFQFNHRDLKSDNIMYTLVDGRPVFKLIDFGFACATFDGVRYEGSAYFEPGIKCFRRSRDLAFLVFEMVLYKHDLFTEDFVNVLKLLLTFKVDGVECRMYAGCKGLQRWTDSYTFLNKDSVENPHTTPEGLLKFITVYERDGLSGCEAAFLLDPVEEVCVAAPPAGPPKLASPPGERSPASVASRGLSVPFTLSPSPGGRRRHTRRRPRHSRRKQTRRFKRN